MLFVRNYSNAREFVHLETVVWFYYGFATLVQGIFYFTEIQSNSFTLTKFLKLFLVYRLPYCVIIYRSCIFLKTVQFSPTLHNVSHNGIMADERRNLKPN